jgi:hypothetical protein
MRQIKKKRGLQKGPKAAADGKPNMVRKLTPLGIAEYCSIIGASATISRNPVILTAIEHHAQTQQMGV